MFVFLSLLAIASTTKFVSSVQDDDYYYGAISNENPGYLEKGCQTCHFRFNRNNTGLTGYQAPLINGTLWKYFSSSAKPSSSHIHSSAVVDAFDNVYIGSSNGILALNPLGSLRWSFSTHGYEVWGTPILAHNNTLIFTCMDNNTYAVEFSGNYVWKFSTNGPIEASPTISPDGTIYTGSDDSFFYAINFHTGKLIWKYKTGTGGAIKSGNVIGIDGNIYFGSLDGHLYALHSTGVLLWSFETNGGVYSTPCITSDQNLAFGDLAGYIYYVNRFSGSLVWKYQTSGPVYASAAFFNPFIYVGDYDGNFLALNTSGVLQWSHKAAGNFYSSGMVDVDNAIIVGNTDGNVIYFREDGVILWTYQTGAAVYSSLAVNTNNTVFVGNMNGQVIAISNVVNNNNPNGASSSTNSSGKTIIIIVAVVVPVAMLLIVLAVYMHYQQQQVNGKSLIGSYGSKSGGGSGNGNVSMQDNPLRNSAAIPPLSIKYLSQNMMKASSQAPSVSLGDPVALLRRNVPTLDWRAIRVDSTKTEEVIVGVGSFGVVAKAKWSPMQWNQSLSASQAFGLELVSTVTHTVPAFGAYSSPSLVSSTSSATSAATGTGASPEYVLDALGETPVAVKVLTKAQLSGDVHSSATELYEKAIKAAIEEVSLIRTAEEKIVFKDCIVKVFGIVNGILPLSISRVVNVGDHSEAVGIVMRYEGGGSLQQMIYRNNKDTTPISILEKLRLLKSIARGIAELHAAGIVHADIKPDNVLLSSDVPPEIHLADFGLSTIRGGASLNLSTLAQTKHVKGTPIYCAPEILLNPFANMNANTLSSDLVAKPSRKTDIYAFALLMWEFLAEQRPFQGAPNEIVLSSMVHQGQRPSLDLIPKECPAKVVALIEACWSSDRSKRKSAVECFSLLQYQHGLMTMSAYDVFLSFEPSTLALTNLVFHRLTQKGCRVWLKQELGESSHSVSNDNNNNGNEMIASCRVFLLVANRQYQHNNICMQELRDAKALQPPRPIVPVFVEKDYFNWSEAQEFIYLCQLRSASLVSFDLSELASTQNGGGTTTVASSIALLESEKSGGVENSGNSAVAVVDEKETRNMEEDGGYNEEWLASFNLQVDKIVNFVKQQHKSTKA